MIWKMMVMILVMTRTKGTSKITCSLIQHKFNPRFICRYVSYIGYPRRVWIAVTHILKFYKYIASLITIAITHDKYSTGPWISKIKCSLIQHTFTHPTQVQVLMQVCILHKVPQEGLDSDHVHPKIYKYIASLITKIQYSIHTHTFIVDLYIHAYHTFTTHLGNISLWSMIDVTACFRVKYMGCPHSLMSVNISQSFLYNLYRFSIFLK